MGDCGPRPGTAQAPSRMKRGRMDPEPSKSPAVLTPPVDRRQRRHRSLSTSPEVVTTPDIAGYQSFLVYLPNATSVDVPVDRAILDNLSVRTFLEIVRTQNPTAGVKFREVQWTNDVYLELFDAETVEDGDFCTLLDEDLFLYDNHPETVHSDPGSLSVTPVPNVPETLPQDYTVFAALADQLDHFLQAVCQLNSGKRRLISVDLDHKNGKIVIFDTGKGMRGDENGISKWGTLGESMNRQERSETVGGAPPYLKVPIHKFHCAVTPIEYGLNLS